MARPRKWIVRTLSGAEISACRAFLTRLRKLESSSNIRERLRIDWELFMVLNGLGPSPAALELFVADLAIKLAPSTGHEYASKLSSLGCMRLPGMRTCLNSLTRLLNIRAADAECRVAVAVDHQTAEKVIQAIADPAQRAAVAAILVLGPRAQDVTHLRPKQIDVTHVPLSLRPTEAKKRYYRAQVRVAKNRKSLGKRINLYIPVDLRATVRPTANRLSRWLESVDPEEKVFARCGAGVLNKAIEIACLKVGTPKLTTYSFRRLFISEAIRYYKRDFVKVREVTLHFAEETLKAYYDRW